MTKSTVGPYVVLDSKDMYVNRWMRLREDQVIRPGGTRGVFGVVEMRSGSSVLALTDAGEACLVKEFKYAIGRDSYELPSGAIEDGESPLAAAKRELQEEAGLTATEWFELGVVDPFTTLIKSPNFMFLALGVQPTEASPDEGEVLEVENHAFPELVEMVMRGEITHAASCVLILKAARWLHDHRPDLVQPRE